MKLPEKFNDLDKNMAAMYNYYISLPEHRFISTLEDFSNKAGSGDEYHACDYIESSVDDKYVIFYDWSHTEELVTEVSKEIFVEYLEAISTEYLLTNEDEKEVVENLLNKIKSI